ncbi:MAG: TIGR04219 family outer membrane beta-barrel protein [Thermodesulfobacteriota bacterium]|nr:TIGR04219 family outer membrane beta-barrel protein [Thermodesulfobacteriota bacterium]
MRKSWIGLGLALLLAVPATSFAIGLEAAIGGWGQDISGDMAYKPLNPITDVIDFERDLGYDSETRVMGRVRIDMPLIIPNIYVMATPMEFEGVGQQTFEFKFGNDTFEEDIPYTSKLSMNHVDVGLFYSIPLLKMATFNKLNIDLGLNIKVADLSAEITQPDTGLSEKEDYVLPVPMAFAAIQINPIDLLAIEAEGRGISYSDNHLFNVIGRVKVKPFGPLFIAGGYRYDSIKLDEEDLRLDAQVDGFFAETGFEF